MNKQKVDDLVNAFRKSRGQLLVNSNASVKGVPEKRQKRNITSDKYSKFLDKYHDLENSYTEFTTQDLVYFFREKARESGTKYVIANMKRDMGIFKRLKENFEVSEILLIIEFLFSEDIDYLDNSRVQPTILASNWVNTLYKDSLDWANDCYVPKKSIRTRNENREWKKTNTNSSKIGEWE